MKLNHHEIAAYGMLILSKTSYFYKTKWLNEYLRNTTIELRDKLEEVYRIETFGN